MEKLNQHGRMLKMMKRNSKRGVKNHEFANAGILCYSKRISEMRKDGHTILMEREWINGRATGTFIYHLADDTIEEYPLRFVGTPIRRRKFLHIL